MQKIMIPETSLLVSRFVFGTASLFSAGTRTRRHCILDAVVAHGLTHFDTAPYYGFGVAELDLAPVLRRNPEVTITTKVGLYSPGGESQPNLSVFVRKAAGRLFSSLSQPIIDWSLAHARLSLEASLRRLGRDRIDLLLLHEPHHSSLSTEEWQRWLEDEVKSGRVRNFGIAGNTDRLEPFLDVHSPLAGILQTNDSLLGKEADKILERRRPLQLTYGYVRDAKRRGSFDVRTILMQALTRNATGAVIVSTRRLERVAIFAATADEVAA